MTGYFTIFWPADWLQSLALNIELFIVKLFFFIFLLNNNDNVCCDFLKLKSHFQFSCYARYSSLETSAKNVTCVWLSNHRSPCGTVRMKTFNFLYTIVMWQHLCGHCRKTSVKIHCNKKISNVVKKWFAFQITRSYHSNQTIRIIWLITGWITRRS